MQIFEVIPFFKLQNDTETTIKRLTTMKDEMRSEIIFFFCFFGGGGKGVELLFGRTVLSVLSKVPSF